jgi:hypothetical protein
MMILMVDDVATHAGSSNKSCSRRADAPVVYYWLAAHFSPAGIMVMQQSLGSILRKYEKISEN